MPSARPCADAIGIDTNSKLTIDRAMRLAQMGFKFAIRYLSISQPQPGDIDADEVAIVLNEIGALWLVQHPLLPGWFPSAQLGGIHGASASRNARLAGYSPGVVIWQDLEGISSSASAQAVIDYTCEYGNMLNAAGYAHGLYWGYDTLLTPAQLYGSLPTVHTYWCDFAERTLPVRGFALKQLCNTYSHRGLGFPIDVDASGADAMGDRPMWMSAS